jgi:hypothetical protein
MFTHGSELFSAFGKPTNNVRFPSARALGRETERCKKEFTLAVFL